MNNIQTTFTITDLESFSGIKAHTIRAWERRYGLFAPSRTQGNQRSYDLNSLQKILNIKILNDHGYKISEIADMSEVQIPEHVLNSSSSRLSSDHAIASFKMAMVEFDQARFEEVYQRLLGLMEFREIYLQVFIPFLEQIGLLWQVNRITPANEHFISNLIQQKVLSNIERVGLKNGAKDRHVYVLYLPMNEIHDLGLLFLHYELLSHGKRSIYLGQSVPIESLVDMHTRFAEITFVSYFTVSPSPSKCPGYLERVNEELLSRREDRFWILGRQTTHMEENELPPRVSIFSGLAELMDSEQWKSIEE